MTTTEAKIEYSGSSTATKAELLSPKQQQQHHPHVWSEGVPTKLLRKQQLISEGPYRLPVYTITFAIPNIEHILLNGDCNKKIKSYHDIRLDLGDVVKMVIPNYKPKSYSVSAVRNNEFDVTYKLYPNGRASGYLHSIQVNEMKMHTFIKHSSRYHNPGTHIGIIVYGVGITEGLPVARAELERHTHDNTNNPATSNVVDVQKLILVWASRTMADTFWHGDIEKLQQLYPTRFQIVHVLSREQPPPLTSSTTTSSIDTSNTNTCQVIYGRLNETILNSLFSSFTAHHDMARFLPVGTKDMMHQTDTMLENIGYPMPEHSLLPKISKEK